MSVPVNYWVAVVICPVCHEPVIADVALSMSADVPEPGPLMIRHHVERRVHATGIEYCMGSKNLVADGVRIDPTQLVDQPKIAGPDVRIEFEKENRVTVHERMPQKIK